MPMEINDMAESGEENRTGGSSEASLVNTNKLVDALVEACDEDGAGTGYTQKQLLDKMGVDYSDASDESINKAFVNPTNTIHKNVDEYLEGTGYVDIARRKKDGKWYYTLVNREVMDHFDGHGFNSDNGLWE